MPRPKASNRRDVAFEVYAWNSKAKPTLRDLAGAADQPSAPEGDVQTGSAFDTANSLAYNVTFEDLVKPHGVSGAAGAHLPRGDAVALTYATSPTEATAAHLPLVEPSPWFTRYARVGTVISKFVPIP